jgi:hypothetical protein
VLARDADLDSSSFRELWADMRDKLSYTVAYSPDGTSPYGLCQMPGSMSALQRTELCLWLASGAGAAFQAAHHVLVEKCWKANPG